MKEAHGEDQDTGRDCSAGKEVEEKEKYIKIKR
jgi:hypothetical protein